MNRSISRAINSRIPRHITIGCVTSKGVPLVVIGKPDTISQQLSQAAAYAMHGIYEPQDINPNAPAYFKALSKEITNGQH